MKNIAGIHTKGLSATLARLNTSAQKIKGLTQAGLIQAAFLVIRESGRIIPIDTGNLRASSFVVWDKSAPKAASFKGKGASEMGKEHLEVQSSLKGKVQQLKDDLLVIFGYTANYAIYVHEDPDAHHTDGKTYKFLEIAIGENEDAMLREIANHARKGL